MDLDRRTKLRLFGLFAICFVTLELVHEVWRPRADRSGVGAYLLGVAPNLLSAVGLPAVFVLIGSDLGLRVRRVRFEQLATGASTLGLIAWETVQIWSPNGTFDTADIVWTLVGATLFLALWGPVVGPGSRRSPSRPTG